MQHRTWSVIVTLFFCGTGSFVAVGTLTSFDAVKSAGRPTSGIYPVVPCGAHEGLTKHDALYYIRNMHGLR